MTGPVVAAGTGQSPGLWRLRYGYRTGAETKPLEVTVFLLAEHVNRPTDDRGFAPRMIADALSGAEASAPDRADRPAEARRPGPPLSVPHGTLALMTPDALKAICLGLNGAVETFPFTVETSVFKVGGKIFAITALDAEPLSVSLKCDPEVALQLRAAHAEITGGWHLNKRHWNTVRLDGALPGDLVREMIEDSYDLIVSRLPRAEQLRLDWPGVRGAAGR